MKSFLVTHSTATLGMLLFSSRRRALISLLGAGMIIGRQGAILAVAAALSGCVATPALETNYVEVDPVTFVPCENKPVPNSRCGYLETTIERAEMFRVRIGELRYQRLIEPLKAKRGLVLESAVQAAATLAEREIVTRGYCKAAVVPPEFRRLFGPQGPWEIWMYVRCNQKGVGA
ncbi:MAG TPA: hypothetical protein VM532_08505 [Burkholderiales bacterium]|nr:hypothetical protein [Burkholderiales bacterium]